MPKRPDPPPLSRRERQIMDVIHALGRATAAEVHERLPDAPTQTAVRTLLRILEDKGHLRHVRDGVRHVYHPTVARDKAQRSAAGHLLRTFFGGSPAAAVATLLDLSERRLTDEEREELVALIRRERDAAR
jgi:predicted transcriptional regulator